MILEYFVGRIMTDDERWFRWMIEERYHWQLNDKQHELRIDSNDESNKNRQSMQNFDPEEKKTKGMLLLFLPIEIDRLHKMYRSVCLWSIVSPIDRDSLVGDILRCSTAVVRMKENENLLIVRRPKRILCKNKTRTIHFRELSIYLLWYLMSSNEFVWVRVKSVHTMNSNRVTSVSEDVVVRIKSYYYTQRKQKDQLKTCLFHWCSYSFFVVFNRQ